MSKGLEALQHPRIKSARVDISAEGKHDIAYMFFDDTKQYAAIEKELKQAEEDRKVLDIFKNALAIERNEQNISFEPLESSEDFVGLLVTNITTIRTNELDKCLRETLKRWVLKNAFPKELKALDIIKRTAMKLISLEDDTTICRKGRYAFYDSELYQSVDLTKEEYDLLKEVFYE